MTTTIEDVTCYASEINEGHSFSTCVEEGDTGVKKFRDFTRVYLLDPNTGRVCPHEYVYAVEACTIAPAKPVYVFEGDEVVRMHDEDGFMMTTEEYNDMLERNRKFHEVMDQTQESVNAHCNPPCLVRYSAYPTNPPRNNLDEKAIEGWIAIYMPGDELFAEGESKDYYSRVLYNPKWIDVAYHANEAIKTTGDEHHAFLEGVAFKGIREDGVMVYELVMGS